MATDCTFDGPWLNLLRHPTLVVTPSSSDLFERTPTTSRPRPAARRTKM